VTSQLADDIQALSDIERPSASPGEESAARWIASRFKQIGLQAQVDSFKFNPDYWTIWGSHGLLASAGAGLALVGRRPARVGAALSALTAISFWGELTREYDLLRKLFPTRNSYNVLARLPNPGASRVLIISAHHDAPRSGLVFHPRIIRTLSRIFGPARDQRVPFGGTLAAMLSISAGAAVYGLKLRDKPPRRSLLLAGLLTLLFSLSMWNISRGRLSPGANDDASGVAVLLALAEATAREPLAGVEVWFLSTGSEEGILGGMQAFMGHYRRDLEGKEPFVLNLEMLGSGHICYLAGEGFVRRYPYSAEAVARAAAVAAEPKFEAVRTLHTAPFATDALVATQLGIPAVTVASVSDDGSVPHYHWPTDTPENVDLRSVENAYTFCHRLIQSLTEDRNS